MKIFAVCFAVFAVCFSLFTLYFNIKVTYPELLTKRNKKRKN